MTSYPCDVIADEPPVLYGSNPNLLHLHDPLILFHFHDPPITLDDVIEVSDDSPMLFRCSKGLTNVF